VVGLRQKNAGSLYNICPRLSFIIEGYFVVVKVIGNGSRLLSCKTSLLAAWVGARIRLIVTGSSVP
jgi:hypothetical protein